MLLKLTLSIFLCMRAARTVQVLGAGFHMSEWTQQVERTHEHESVGRADGERMGRSLVRIEGRREWA